MKTRWFAAAAAAALLSVGVALPQSYVRVLSEQKHVTLASAFNLNGAAATANKVVTVATLADSTTFTIAAQPTDCRLIDATVVDADSSITAGTLTVTGTDCFGYARVCTFDFAVVATRGSGVKTLPVTTGPSGSSCYLGAVTSVVSSALTGEGGAGDTLTVGYTSNSQNTWTGYGKLNPVGPNGEHSVDLLSGYASTLPMTTSGVASTTVTSVATNACFTNVAATDLLQFSVGGVPYEVTVSARASANSITVSKPVTIPSAGVVFTYKHRYTTTDPTDQIWIPVSGWKNVAFNYSVDSNTDTGGVIGLLECIDSTTPDWPTGKWVPVETVTTLTGNTQSPSMTVLGPVDLTLSAFTFCRVGMRFGTGDDDDTGIEDINLSAALSK